MYSYIGLFVAVTALINSAFGQVTVDVTPNGVSYIKYGDSLEMTCVTNQEIDFIIENEVSWFKVNPDQERLTQTGSLKADDTKYALDLDHSDVLVSKLRILSADSTNTGDYECRAGGVSGTVKVIVVKEVEHVELKINKNPAVIGEEINPYEAEFEKKKTNIECTASGSYPEANIHLFLGNDEIQPESGLNTKPLGDFYKTSIVARKILYPKHNGKILSCVASVNVPQESNIQPMKKVSSIPLHIITLVPLISCKNTTASIQDIYVKLECDVSADKPMKRLFWKLGYNKQIIYPGDKTEDYDEVTVEKIEGSDRNKRIVLEIYKMKKEHFDSVFYLIVEDSNGEIFQEPVYIRECHNCDKLTYWDRSSSTMLQPCLLTLLVLAIITLVKC